jgi:predicted nucleic acid-binding protein
VRSYYLDASAIVRLYIVEPGSSVVRDIFRSAVALQKTAQVLTCDLSLPETVSALLQVADGSRGPARGLSRAALRHILPRVRSQFAGESQPFNMVPATNCMESAADLIEKHRLRVADAVHLAAALEAKDSLPSGAPFLFVSDDVAQCRAAESEGLEVLRPAA